MPNALQVAGALGEPTDFAPLHTNRIFTGLWTNRSPMRDAATSDYQEHFGMGRQDSIIAGYNSEITSKLTLARRAGTSIYNPDGFYPPIKRWYSFNTFTLTSELIRVMADTALNVYDATNDATGNKSIWRKSSGAGSTYFLGVGNTLYFTNGVDNKQWNYGTNTVTDWGITGPANAPTVSLIVKPNPGYGSWQPSQVYSVQVGPDNAIVILDPSGTNLQMFVRNFGTHTYPDGHTGSSEPPTWNTGAGATTVDGQITWNWAGLSAWIANTLYTRLGFVAVTIGGQQYLFAAQTALQGNGISGATPPAWTAALGSYVQDAGVVWQNLGLLLTWPAIGPGRYLTNAITIIDTNGYFQTCLQSGLTGAGSPLPNFQTSLGALTLDNNAIWSNTGSFNAAQTAPVQYGYAYQSSTTTDLSNMSPRSILVQTAQGQEVTIQGVGTGDAQVDTIPIYRTAQGGSTLLLLTTIPNPGAGHTWTYTDTTPDSGLNAEIQAQVNGEGTRLPVGATCLGYHIGRIFAAVGNVVYISSGPDAVASGSSGNSGFDTTFTAQSKITRFWTCSLGMVVFTVRDAYIILGSGTAADPLYMVVFIDNLPLRSYDCFTVNKGTPYLLLGNNQLVSLDPSAGIIEVGFPIADILEDDFDSSTSYVTFHSQSSRDSALYVASGTGFWYRMAQNNAPEQGSNWSTRANIAGMGAIQSVEVTPGQYRLLISGTATGYIFQRDRTKNTDNGTAFAVDTVFGNIVLAQPGQLAALSFITLESARVGTRAGLALLLGEISGTFDPLSRTRQDPTNLPPSETIYSDRYHFAQNQNTAWCRHFQMDISWPAEDAANELYTFTIFGQTWQEMRSQ